MNKVLNFFVTLVALAINAVYKNTDAKVEGIRNEVTQQVDATRQGFESEVSGIKTAVKETEGKIEATRQEFGQQVGSVKEALTNVQAEAEAKYATKADVELDDLAKLFRNQLLVEIQKGMGDVPEEKA
jgi:phage-related protein